jgi:hypothetical protein
MLSNTIKTATPSLTHVHLSSDSHRHIVTPKNDIDITGNGDANEEIVKESIERVKKEARDAVAVVTVAVQENDDPSLKRTSECLRNLRESEQSRKQGSKLADLHR